MDRDQPIDTFEDIDDFSLSFEDLARDPDPTPSPDLSPVAKEGRRRRRIAPEGSAASVAPAPRSLFPPPVASEPSLPAPTGALHAAPVTLPESTPVEVAVVAESKLSSDAQAETDAGSNHRPLWHRAIGPALLLAVIILGRTFIAGPYSIPTESMTPTLAVGTRIAVNKTAYWFSEPSIGDAIVFDLPKGVDLGPGITVLAKRIVAVAGDTIDATQCTLRVNGEPVIDPAAEKISAGECSGMFLTTKIDPDGDLKVTVPAGSVFVMGDNRHVGGSVDSRIWGFVPDSDIIGRIVGVYWPFNQMRWV